MIEQYPHMCAVEAVNLTKVYRPGLFASRPLCELPAAVNDVSMSVRQGETVAVIGPKGAGKTTLLKLILGLVRPTSGMVFVGGWASTSDAWKPLVGYLPQDFRADPRTTPVELLRLMGRLQKMEADPCERRVLDLLTNLELEDVKHKRLSALTESMLLRVGIAQAIVHKPRIVLLDEPTDGLDRAGRKIVHELICSLRDDGVAIIITSHLLTEVEALAERTAIMVSGKLVMLPDTCASLCDSQRSLEEIFHEHMKEERV